MELLKNITVSIPKESIEKMIQKQLNDEGFIVKSVEFKVEKRFLGYGPGEHEISTFTEVVCEVEKK